MFFRFMFEMSSRCPLSFQKRLQAFVESLGVELAVPLPDDTAFRGLTIDLG
jgi:hypothetical protein